MKSITFYGSSDDNICFEIIEANGKKTEDELGQFSDVLKRPIILNSPTWGSAKVYPIFDGCWHFSYGQVNEETALPKWKVSLSVSSETHYSMALRIEAADDTTLDTSKYE